MMCRLRVKTAVNPWYKCAIHICWTRLIIWVVMRECVLICMILTAGLNKHNLCLLLIKSVRLVVMLHKSCIFVQYVYCERSDHLSGSKTVTHSDFFLPMLAVFVSVTLGNQNQQTFDSMTLWNITFCAWFKSAYTKCSTRMSLCRVRNSTRPDFHINSIKQNFNQPRTALL